jgi:hypothetical protein
VRKTVLNDMALSPSEERSNSTRCARRAMV